MFKTPFDIFETDLTVDVAPIILELARVTWEPHFMRLMADNGNSAHLLITSDGTVYNRDGRPNHRFALPMLPTTNLAAMPATRDVWRQLGLTGWHRSRFMKIEPGFFMPAHNDVNFYWKDKCRLHIPIVTTPDVMFTCGADTINMEAGKVYLIDNSERHTVINPSASARIHLVIDVLLTDVEMLTNGTQTPPDRPGFRLSDPSWAPASAEETLNREAKAASWDEENR